MNKKFHQNIELPVSDRPKTCAQYYSPQEFNQYWRFKQGEDPKKVAWEKKIQQNTSKNKTNYFPRNIRTPQSQKSHHFSYLQNNNNLQQEKSQDYQEKSINTYQLSQQQQHQQNEQQQQQQSNTLKPQLIQQYKPDLPKPMKYISQGKKQDQKCQNCHFKDTSPGLQQIIEGFPEYFDHLRGDCACGKCICGNCKCEIHRLPKQMPNLNPSHYQQNYGPKENKYLNGQLDRNIANPPAQTTHPKPIDNNTTTKTSYLKPGATSTEFFKRKQQPPENQELIGHSNYDENYKDWGNNKQGLIRPCNATEILNKVPFAGMSNYDENYNKKHGLDKDPAIAKIIEKCKKPMFKSPINPSNFPFIGQSTSQRNFHPFSPDYNKYSKMNFSPAYLPSTLWKTTHARDFNDKGEIECPGREYIRRSMMKKRNYY